MTARCALYLKSVALPVPKIIGAPRKFGQSLDTPMLLFLHNFNGFFVPTDTVNAPAKYEVCTSPVPEITAIGVLVGGCEP